MQKILLNKLSILLVCVFFIIIFFILGFSYSYYKQVYDNEFSLIKTRSSQQVTHVKKKIISSLDSIITEVLSAGEYSSLGDYILNQNSATQENLSSEFLALTKYRKKYDQIRFIGIDGKEKVRVNYNYGNPQIVRKDLLQDISSRYYFNDLMELEKGEIYISKFDLNIENGRIELPYKSVIRVGVPIFLNGEKKGALVFNYLAEELLYSLYEVGFQDSISYLYNSDGYLLKGLDPDDEWGFMFNDRKEKTLARQKPDLWEKINSIHDGFIEDKNGLYVISTIHPEENIVNKGGCACNYWKLVVHTSGSVLRAQSGEVMYYLILINIFIISTLAVIFWVLIRFLFYKQISEGKILELNDTLQVINKILRHDLSNAFTSISLNLDVYEKDLNNSEFVSSIREVVSGGKNLIHHMKELEGMVSLGEDLKSKKLHDILLNIIKKYKIKIELKGRARAHCDDAIETVFENIISNALRHGRTKKMKINLKRAKKGVKIEFIDYGKGMPHEIQKKVFDEGFKYGKAANTGLGLFIVKKTINRYGGTVSVKGNIPKGVIFTIFIPR